MRIVHTESSMTMGGRELAVLAMVEGLCKRGHEVQLLVEPRSVLSELAQRRGLPCWSLGMSKARYPIAILTLRRLLERHRIEIVHTHSSRDRWIAALAASLSRPRPRVILGRHHCAPLPRSLLSSLLYRRLADCLVTTGGERLRRQLIEQTGLSEDHVAGIPTGVDLDRFTPERDGGGVREQLGIPAAAPLIGTVCFLRDYKGLDYFVASAARLRDRIPQARFLIAGDGPERCRLEAAIERAGLTQEVRLAGHRDDVPEVMAALDVFVVTSTGGETLTQVIPQALAMEKPVVATNVGSIPDIVEDGVTGVLVPPRDVGRAADAVRWLLQHREAALSMAKAGRRLVAQEFSAQAAVQRTEALYRRLLDEAGRRGRVDE